MFFTPEYSFRKLFSNEMQFSRTLLLREATDVRWVRLKRSTRAKAHTQGERPCYAKSRSHSLPQLPSARSRWLPPPRWRTGRAAEGVAALVAFIITTGAPASASATSAAAMVTTDAT